MTNDREFNASNIEAAVEKASAELDVRPDELFYEVVDKGSEGFLGIGARDARILVRIPETTADDLPHSQPLTEASDDPEDGPTNPPEPDERRDELSDLEPDEDESLRDSPVPDETLEEVRKLTTSFVSAMGFNGRVDVYETDDAIALDIASDHAALLIGQKGETLDSLQHLINCAAHQQTSVKKRIVLDSEGYRQRRIEALQGMAHRTARKAVRENRETHLPPMPSTERRVVHLYLESDTNVSTYSEGSGDQRRVVISPAAN